MGEVFRETRLAIGPGATDEYTKEALTRTYLLRDCVNTTDAKNNMKMKSLAP